ncbi:hypothetical protein Asal01_00913 [Fodinibius salicampi]
MRSLIEVLNDCRNPSDTFNKDLEHCKEVKGGAWKQRHVFHRDIGKTVQPLQKADLNVSWPVFLWRVLLLLLVFQPSHSMTV